MLYATKFKFDKCHAAIKNYDEWRTTLKINPMAEELLVTYFAPTLEIRINLYAW